MEQWEEQMKHLCWFYKQMTNLTGKHICEYTSFNKGILLLIIIPLKSSSYTGRTKIDRLLYLAVNCPPLRQVCSSAAAELIKSTTTDTTLYYRAIHIHNTSAQSGAQLTAKDQLLAADETWSMQSHKSNQDELEKLDLELRHYQNNLIKESVRVSVLIRSI